MDLQLYRDPCYDSKGSCSLSEMRKEEASGPQRRNGPSLLQFYKLSTSRFKRDGGERDGGEREKTFIYVHTYIFL